MGAPPLTAIPGSPIVLAHGYLPFDVPMRLAGAALPFPRARRWFDRTIRDPLGYFRLVGRTLRARGFEVHEPTVSFAGSLPRRAAGLAAAIRRILAGHAPGAKVHIIAHSMGGLDARYMIARLGLADGVATLTTIGTPHLGSSYADWRVERAPVLRPLVRAAGAVGLDLGGTWDLTTWRCRRLNEDLEAAEAANPVIYITYTSRQDHERRVFWPLRRAWRVVRGREGPTDGLVSVASQRWTEVLRGPGGLKAVEQRDFPFPADHLNQTGWWHPWACPPRDRRAFEERVRHLYIQLAEDLRARGP